MRSYIYMQLERKTLLQSSLARVQRGVNLYMPHSKHTHTHTHKSHMYKCEGRVKRTEMDVGEVANAKVNKGAEREQE